MKNLTAAIARRGRNDTTRGESLGVCKHAATKYRSGQWPMQWLILLHNPDLAEAMAADARDMAEKQRTAISSFDDSITEN